MSVFGIQGHLLEITVVGCSKLKDTEWISRQDPYVCLEYASTRFRTRTCTDGGKNPIFQEKFVFTLIEGLRELNILVWNSNTLTNDDFIGNGKVQLHKVISTGYDDNAWPIQTKTGRHAGEVRLIMHYADANKAAASSYAQSAPPYVMPAASQVSMYHAPQVSMYSAPPPAAGAPYQLPGKAYTNPASYPSYPPRPESSFYPPHAYPPQPSAYAIQSHSSSSAYPPPSYAHQSQPFYPPGPVSGIYPPPPY